MLMVPAAVMGGGGNMVDMFGGGIEVFVFDDDDTEAPIGGGMLRFGGGMRIRFVVDDDGVAPFMGGGGLFICISIFCVSLFRSFVLPKFVVVHCFFIIDIFLIRDECVLSLFF